MVYSQAVRGWTSWLFGLFAHSYYVVFVVILGTWLEVAQSACMVNSHEGRGWTSLLLGLFARSYNVVLVVINRHLVGGWSIGIDS